jgi:imidazolonepropionase-like amidohydrolase
MHLRSLSATFLLCLTVCRPLPAQSAPPKTTLITHVTVMDVSTGSELSNRTVTLQGDRIVSVSVADSDPSPQDRVIDAHGGFLIPGLWDMHVHIQDLEDLPLYIANGVTGDSQHAAGGHELEAVDRQVQQNLLQAVASA